MKAACIRICTICYVGTNINASIHMVVVQIQAGCRLLAGAYMVWRGQIQPSACMGSRRQGPCMDAAAMGRTHHV